jgi:hypothetical protein
MPLPTPSGFGAETEQVIADLPDDIRRALFPHGIGDAPRDGGHPRLMVEGDLPAAPEPMGTTQLWHYNNKLKQSKPIPNLQGGWQDGEIVFRFPTADQAEDLYMAALGWLLPGEVNLVLVPANDQYTVHVAPAVQVTRPEVVQQLLAIAATILGSQG